MTAAAKGTASLKLWLTKNLLRSKFLCYAALLTLISGIFIAFGLRWSIAASSQEPQLLSPYFPVCQSSSTFAPPCRDRELARRFFVGGIKENESVWCDSQSSAEASCLVPPPREYRKPVPWPVSLRKAWYLNVPFKSLPRKPLARQWLKPARAMQWQFSVGVNAFVGGANAYVRHLGHFIPFGGYIRTALDIGAGIGNFAAALLKHDVITLSVAPHHSRYPSQVAFSLERGLPSLLLSLSTLRLPFPSHAFDFIHASHCPAFTTVSSRLYFLEVHRLLRPGGFFVLAGAPVASARTALLWEQTLLLTRQLCWQLKQLSTSGHIAIWRKVRRQKNGLGCTQPSRGLPLEMCDNDTEGRDRAWNVSLPDCQILQAPALPRPNLWPARLWVTSPRVDLQPKSSSGNTSMTSPPPATPALPSRRRLLLRSALSSHLSLSSTPSSPVFSHGVPIHQPPLSPPNLHPSCGNHTRRRQLFSLFGWGKWSSSANSSTSGTGGNQAGNLGRKVGGKRVSEQQRLFNLDSRRWRQRVSHYMNSFLGLPMKRGQIRNILDMSAGLGGFAASLWLTERDSVWVMSVVPAAADLDTLPLILDRGLVGTVHDWCEPFASYPRSYDLIHLNGLDSLHLPSLEDPRPEGEEPDRCTLSDIVIEMDRLLRPFGIAIIRDDFNVLERIQGMAESARWIVRSFPDERNSSSTGVLVAMKPMWTVNVDGTLALSHNATNYTELLGGLERKSKLRLHTTV